MQKSHEMAITATFLLMLFVATAPGGPVPAHAGFLETKIVEEGTTIYILRGAFGRIENAHPSETIFSFEIQSGGGQSHEKFYFSGQKDDKTFEVRHTYGSFSGFRGGKPPEEKMVITVGDNNVFPLPLTRFSFPGCTAGGNAALKVHDLKINRLKHEIILPECLRKVLPVGR